MLRSFLLALSLATTTAYAQEPYNAQIPVLCGDAQNIVDGLNEKYDEEITFMSPSQNEVGDDLFHSLWVNNQTQTWSFIVLNKQKSVVCVLASGQGFKLLSSYGI